MSPRNATSGAISPDWSESADPAREVYVDRAHLAALVATHPALTARLAHDRQGRAGLATVLYLHGPTGQIAHHIADEDLSLFEHVARADDGDPLAVWDGHTKDMARSRLVNLVELLTVSPRYRCRCGGGR